MPPVQSRTSIRRDFECQFPLERRSRPHVFSDRLLRFLRWRRRTPMQRPSPRRMSSLGSGVAGVASSEEAGPSPSEKHGVPGNETSKPGDGGSVSSARVGAAARSGQGVSGSSPRGLGCPLAAPIWRAGRGRCTVPRLLPSVLSGGGGLLSLGLKVGVV